MKSILLPLVSVACMLSYSASVWAQSTSQQRFSEAQSFYNNGKFTDAEQLLLTVTSDNDKMLRSGALRLLALCHIEQGDMTGANEYVKLLLNNDPYYTASYTDNRNFIDLLERNKHRGATITTASQQAETIEEAPVPVTLITEDMLQSIGARTLKEALIAYVPGMTDVANNDEMNIAMRGIYSSSQEKILILLNGHRLNSYSTNAATPDFSMSLEKVKQIEVLRGPASSIYGGVALTAVVNIITKDGSDVDGFRAKGSLGNYGQMQGDLLFGKSYMGLDIMAWANIYTAKGEKVHLTEDEQPFALMPTEGDMILGAYNKKPTYDLGCKIGFNGFNILYNRRFSKTVSTMTMAFMPYSYEKYRYWNGNAPGFATDAQHTEFSYSHQGNQFSWLAKAFCDMQTNQRYQIAGDSIPEVGFNDIFPNGLEDVVVKMYRGGFQSVNSKESTVGFKIQSNYNYHLGENQSGSILLGGEVSYFDLFDASYMEGIDYNLIIRTYNTDKVLLTGNETSADAYLQIKHNLGKHFILNLGGRYDYKLRRTRLHINEFSPRFALIYNNPKVNLKLSYSKSFVDAPYYYRSNNFDVNFGDESLKPEYLHSFQLSFLSDKKVLKNCYIDLNAFVNIAQNFIVNDGLANVNAGKLSTTGVEFIGRYDLNKFRLETNLSWQKVLSSEMYEVFGSDMYNIPSIKWNVLARYEIIKGLSVNASTLFTSAQTSYCQNPETGELMPIDLDPVLTVNAGVNYTYKDLGLVCNVYNLLNKQYQLGGSTTAPLIQPGRWILGSVSYNF